MSNKKAPTRVEDDVSGFKIVREFRYGDFRKS